MEEQKVTQQIYPTEVVDLPSRGLLYPEDSPLRSGTIEMYLMTAKHEDILTSTNLIRKGIVIDKLMDSLIATKGVKSSDLVIGDLNALMVAARILGYGKDYKINVSCPACGSDVTQVVDLSELQTKNEPTESTGNNISVVLPMSKAEVVLKFLTRSDELAIDKEVESLKKANIGSEGDTTARLRAMIQSVNGDASKTAIWNFVEGMLVRDARYLREAYRNNAPDVDFTVHIECECDSSEDKTVRLPIGTDFFWPDAGV
jgi:hypothetical protein